MKKLMLILLLAVPLCKAADDESWKHATQKYPDIDTVKYLPLSSKGITHLPENLHLPEAITLVLANNQIKDIPKDISLPNVESLSLKKNLITFIDSEKLLKSFPKLRKLILGENQLTPENIDDLRSAAQETHPELEITADNILPRGYAGGVKPAKE